MVTRRQRQRGARSTEAALAFELGREGITGWESAPRDLVGKPDFVFRHRRLAVFTDGCFWHGCPRHYSPPRANPARWGARMARQRQLDAEVERRLKGSGWRVLRLWEHEINEDPRGCVRQVLALLR